jgi:hypothetical protein
VIPTPQSTIAELETFIAARYGGGSLVGYTGGRWTCALYVDAFSMVIGGGATLYDSFRDAVAKSRPPRLLELADACDDCGAELDADEDDACDACQLKHIENLLKNEPWCSHPAQGRLRNPITGIEYVDTLRARRDALRAKLGVEA